MAVGQVAEVGFEAVGGLQRVRDAHHVAAEPQAGFIHVQHDDLGTRQFGKDDRGQADRARTDDEDRLLGRRRGPVDGVAADGEGLDEGELVEGEVGRGVELPRRQQELRAQAAVAVDAQDLQLLAAVRVAAAAGVAVGIINIRLHGAAVAGLDVGDALADGDDLDAQLVAGDARVAEEGHLAEVAAEVRPADADPVDAHQGLAGSGRGGLGGVDEGEVLGGLQEQGFHGCAAPGRSSLLAGRPST